MASITIRDLDARVKERLRVRAARHGRSMEDEARAILREAVSGPDRAAKGLATAIHRRFEAVGGVDLRTPAREPMREPPKLS